MTKITPTIRLLSYQESLERGVQHKCLMLEHNGISYHLLGGTRDTIQIFTQSIIIYVLTISSRLSEIRLDAYIPKEPDPVDTVFLHSEHQIREALGEHWNQMKPETIVSRLSQYFC